MRWLVAPIMAISLGGAAQASDDLISPAAVLAAVSHDWNNDGLQDRAVLVEGTEDADLYLSLSIPGTFERRVAAIGRNIAWRGEMAGTRPNLALSDSGSLLVQSMNESIGRTRWVETLTITFRDGSFVVAGYTRVERDTVIPENRFDCDVNLLTGKGIFNDAPFGTSQPLLPVERWHTDLARICPEG